PLHNLKPNPNILLPAHEAVPRGRRLQHRGPDWELRRLDSGSCRCCFCVCFIFRHSDFGSGDERG
ncbi:hypothetical protein IFR05_017376, partial [Cadophora sp. M221]